MASRRMLAVKVITSDDYLALPLASQAVYPQLNVRADDDGLVDCVRSVVRSLDVDNTAVDALVDAGYLLHVGNNVYAVTHWHQHNRVKPDRYHPTRYTMLRSRLCIDDSGLYEVIPN